MPYVYHGTSEYNALLIQNEGFKKGTYFTPHLDSALVMGGEYVFAVWLEKGEYDSLPWMKAGEDVAPWQFQLPEDWGSERICSLVHYNAELLYVNEREREGECPQCHGCGEIYSDPKYRHAGSWLPKTHFTALMSHVDGKLCPACRGYGSVEKNEGNDQSVKRLTIVASVKAVS